MRFRTFVAFLVLCPTLAFAQQRPLVTEDPETIGAGNILLEGGVDFLQDVEYPASGLAGGCSRAPLMAPWPRGSYISRVRT